MISIASRPGMALAMRVLTCVIMLELLARIAARCSLILAALLPGATKLRHLSVTDIIAQRLMHSMKLPNLIATTHLPGYSKQMSMKLWATTRKHKRPVNASSHGD